MVNDAKLKTEYLRGKSVSEVAKIVGCSKATAYRHLRDMGVIRDKSKAQKNYQTKHGHQRKGSSHDEASRERIRKSQSEFWGSDKSDEARAKISETRKNEWRSLTPRGKKAIVDQLTAASRPKKGELSKFATAFIGYAEDREPVRTGIFIAGKRSAGILFIDRGIVVEIVQPRFGLSELHRKERDELNRRGLHLILVLNNSNSVSQSRCQRLYEQINNEVEVLELD
jgi:hypothetical protein